MGWVSQGASPGQAWRCSPKGAAGGVRGPTNPLSVRLEQDTGQEPETRESRPGHFANHHNGAWSGWVM